MGKRWFVLGFTSDDVVMAWQDARLAQQCAARCDVDALEIQQGPGDGRDLIRWYVSAASARALDDAGVDWRSFLTGECDAPPPAAAPWRPPGARLATG